MALLISYKKFPLENAKFLIFKNEDSKFQNLKFKNMKEGYVQMKKI